MKEKKTRKKQRKMILILSAAVLGVFFLLVMPWISRTVYEENFGERYETQDWLAYSVSDFPGLQVEEDAFASRQGQMLRGYHYTKDGQTPKGRATVIALFLRDKNTKLYNKKLYICVDSAILLLLIIAFPPGFY